MPTISSRIFYYLQEYADLNKIQIHYGVNHISCRTYQPNLKHGIRLFIKFLDKNGW